MATQLRSEGGVKVATRWILPGVVQACSGTRDVVSVSELTQHSM